MLIKCYIFVWEKPEFATGYTLYRKGKVKVSRDSIIQLIVAAIAFCLFLISWLVFKNIKISDWIILAVGVLDLIVFFIGLGKKKNK